MKLANRLTALEARTPTIGQVHRIIVGIGETRDEVLDAYGRDKIGPHDRLIVRNIIAPGGAA